jgi:hypothetical protein
MSVLIGTLGHIKLKVLTLQPAHPPQNRFRASIELFRACPRREEHGVLSIGVVVLLKLKNVALAPTDNAAHAALLVV